MYTLDTNSLIYYAQGEPEISQLINSKDVIFYIPTIVVVEYLAFPDLPFGDKENFLSLINSFDLINLDLKISLLSADLSSKFHIKLADSIMGLSPNCRF